MVKFPVISLVVDAKFIHNFPTVYYVEMHKVRFDIVYLGEIVDKFGVYHKRN